MTRILLALCALVALSVPAQAVTVAGTSGTAGPETLTINGGSDIVTSTAFDVYDATFIKNSDGTTYNPGTGSTGSSYNSTTKTLTRTYPWGSIVVAMPITNAGGIGKMGWTMTVSNTTNGANAATMTKLDINAFKIAMGGSPSDDPNPTYPLLKFGDQDPPALPLTGPNFRMVVVNTDPSKKMGFALFEDGTTNEFTFRLSMHKQPWFPEDVKTIAATTTIAAGTSVTFPLEFRFSDTNVASMTQAGTGTSGTADDVRDAWLAIYPYRVNWPDRRAICQWSPSTSPHNGGNLADFATNPRGWAWIGAANTVNVTTSAGLADFRTRTLAQVDAAILVSKAAKCQLVQIWSIEGEQFQHSDLVGNTALASYVGDPAAVENWAPEMAYIGTSNPANPLNRKLIDEIVEKVRASGLLLGFTYRPQVATVNLAANPPTAYQALASDPSAVLNAKITAARTRWGADLVRYAYVDSNGSPGTAFDPTLAENALTAFPNTLFSFEHENSRYYAVGAPYHESHLNGGIYRLPASVYMLYPQAFWVDYVAIDNLADTTDPETPDKQLVLRQGIQAGDILMHRAWFNDQPTNGQVASMYSTADSSAPTVTSRTPAPSATGIAVGSNITVVFSEVVIPASITATTVQVKQGATIIPATLTQSSDWLTLTINPNADLAAGTTYTVTLKGGSEGILDSHGNTMAADVTWSFTTAGALAGTTVYLRTEYDPSTIYAITNIVNSSTSGAVRVSAGGTFTIGQKVNIDGVYANSGDRGCQMANGTKTVIATGSGYVDVNGRNGEQVACYGAFKGRVSRGTATISLLTSRTLALAPNIRSFDGPTGVNTLLYATAPWRTGNAAYTAIVSMLSNYLTDYAAERWANDALAAGAALAWHANGKPTTSGSTAYTYGQIADDQLMKAWSIGGMPICNEATGGCGKSASQLNDQTSPALDSSALAYAIRRDVLTSDQRTRYKRYMLNDINRYVGQTACTNDLATLGGGTLTATSGSNVLTFSDASALSGLQLGMSVFWLYGTGVSVTNPFYLQNKITALPGTSGLAANQVRIVDNVVSTWAGSGFAWKAVLSGDQTGTENRCGQLWFIKHYGYGPMADPETYPQDGGNSENAEFNNLLLWRHATIYEHGAVLCQDDVNACEQFEWAAAQFMNRTLGWWDNMATGGASSAGSGYYEGRVDTPVNRMATVLQFAVSPPIDFQAKPWVKYSPVRNMYKQFPNRSRFHSYGEAAVHKIRYHELTGTYSALLINPYSTESAIARDWFERAFTDGTGTAAQALSSTTAGIRGRGAMESFFVLGGTLPRTDYKTAPLSYLFADTTLATSPGGWLNLYSKGSWDGSKEISLQVAALGMWVDHLTSGGRDPSGFQLYAGGGFFAGDRGCANLPEVYEAQTNCLSMDGEHVSGNIIGEAGYGSEATAEWQPWQQGIFTPYAGGTGGTIQVQRWAGPRPGGLADYMYVNYEAKNVWSASGRPAGSAPTKFAPEYLHVRKGGRSLIVRRVETATGAAWRNRVLLQALNNGGDGEGHTYFETPNRIRSWTTDDTSVHVTTYVDTGSGLVAPGMTDVDITKSGNTLVVNAGATAEVPRTYNIGGISCTFTAPASVSPAGTTAAGTIYFTLQSNCSISVTRTASGVTAGLTGSYLTAGGVATNYAGTGNPLFGWGVTAAGALESVQKVGNPSSHVTGPLSPLRGTYNARRILAEAGRNTANTTLQVMDVHETADATANPVTVLSATNWDALQVGGDLPTVAAFAKGACRNTFAVTSTHTGTAAYTLAGLCPSVTAYTLTKPDGSTQSLTSTAGDTTVAWDGAAGAYSLSQSGTPAATVTVSPTSVSFGTYIRSGTVPSNQSLTVTISGGTSPSCTIGSSQPWLTVSPTTRTTTGTVTLSLVTGQLPALLAGTRSANVTWSCTDAIAPSPTPVTLLVAEASQMLTTDVPTVNMTMHVGDALPSEDVLVTVAPSGTLGYTATVSGPFTITAGTTGTATTTGVSVTLQPDPTAIVAGLNQGTLTLTPTTGTAIQVPITLIYESVATDSLLVLQRSSDGIRVQVPCAANGGMATVYASLNANLYPVLASKTGRCQGTRATIVLDNLSASTGLYLFGSAGSLASDGSVITRAAGAAGAGQLRSGIKRLTDLRATKARLRYATDKDTIYTPGGGTAGPIVGCLAGCSPTVTGVQLYKGYWHRIEQLDANDVVVRRETPIYVSAGQ